jgi:hypothetical protein
MLAAAVSLWIAPSAVPDSIHLSAAVTGTSPNEFAANLLPAPGGPPPIVEADTVARDEMLVGASGQRHHWPSSPKLVVLTSVMNYHDGESRDYVATSERLDEEESRRLAADLTAALRMLTTGAFEQFAAVEYEMVPAGSTATIVRPNQIVVGRFHGVRRLAKTIGFGGRTARRDGTIVAAAVVLDNEFDQANSMRRLLRTHELGHALGFNHVKARVSIMNPSIGSEMTDHDRQVSRFAFQSSSTRRTE